MKRSVPVFALLLFLAVAPGAASKTRARAGDLQDQRVVDGGDLLESLRPPHSAHGGVKEESVVAFPPPHLSIPQAEHSAKGDLEFFCDESGLCESQSTGPCTRKNAAAIGCRYTAKLKSGEVCRGTFRIKALGEGMISNTPGLLSSEEGECFALFEPRALREREEEEEKKA